MSIKYYVLCWSLVKPTGVSGGSPWLHFILMYMLMQLFVCCDRIKIKFNVKKVCSDVAEYVFRMQSSKHVPLSSQLPADRLIKHHHKSSGKHPAMLQLMHEGCLYEYPPLFIAMHVLIHTAE